MNSERVSYRLCSGAVKRPPQRSLRLSRFLAEPTRDRLPAWCFAVDLSPSNSAREASVLPRATASSNPTPSSDESCVIVSIPASLHIASGRPRDALTSFSNSDEARLVQTSVCQRQNTVTDVVERTLALG